MHKCEHECEIDRRAHECDDQLPLIARVGRGIKGDSFKVTCEDVGTNQDHTILKGFYYDEATKEWSSPVWTSSNINGGRLKMWYRLNPNDLPPTFTQTWAYERGGETEWHWISPAIPYVYYDNPIIGSNAATIYLKDHMDAATDKYKEMLTYPKNATDRNVFNTPSPAGGDSKKTSQWFKEDTGKTHGGAWAVCLDITEFNELAKVTGLTETQLKNIIMHPSTNNCITPSSRSTTDWSTFDNIESDNLKDYIDDMFQAESTKRGTEDRRIDEEITNLQQQINSLKSQYDGLLKKIVEYFYGGTWTARSGSTAPSITFRSNTKAATGDINVYGQPGGSGGGAIMTHKNDSASDNHAGDIIAK